MVKQFQNTNALSRLAVLFILSTARYLLLFDCIDWVCQPTEKNTQSIFRQPECPIGLIFRFFAYNENY